MQIYITKEREKQLREYALSHKISMSSVIDKSLEILFRNPPVLVNNSVFLAPVAHGKPRSGLQRTTKKENIPFD